MSTLFPLPYSSRADPISKRKAASEGKYRKGMKYKGRGAHSTRRNGLGSVWTPIMAVVRVKALGPDELNTAILLEISSTEFA